MKSLQAVFVVRNRSIVMIGTFFCWAYSRAGSRPSELSGEMISAWAPWSIIPLMSEISLFRSDSAFVVISLIPSLAASSLIDWVSAIRNGLASFSDWANPIVAVFRSSFGTPLPLYLSNVHVSPAAAVWTTCWPPLAAGAEAPGLAQAAATVRLAIRPATFGRLATRTRMSLPPPPMPRTGALCRCRRSTHQSTHVLLHQARLP